MVTLDIDTNTPTIDSDPAGETVTTPGEIKTYKAKNISQLLRVVKDLTSQFGRQMFWFRGQPASASPLPLIPAVHRPLFKGSESSLFHIFKNRALARHHNCPRGDEHDKWLTLMQHFRLPTRLLNWTEALPVAAHFAIDLPVGRPIHKPSIWVLAPQILNKKIGGQMKVMPLDELSDRNLVRLGIQELAPLKVDLTNALFLLRTAGDGVEQPGKVLGVIPPQVDLRLFIQSSVFTIHGDSKPLEEFEGAHEFLAKIELPVRTKKSVLARELWQLGFRDSFLFPDLEELAEELRVLSIAEHRIREMMEQEAQK